MHITPNNKLASFGTIGLLFLAGVAGMVFLLPAVHAASPTVTLSTISGLSTTLGGPTELTGVTSGTVGSSLTITGSGFASNAPIEIYSTVGTSSVSWFITNTGSAVAPNTCIISGTPTFASAFGGVGSGNSLYESSGATACLITSAAGLFKVTTVIPALPGGAQTIIVSDGTNSVSTPFTITPKVTISTTGNNFGFPEQTISGTIRVTGFGSGESVTVATTAFTTTSFTCTTGTTLTGGSTAASWGANKLVSGTSAGTCTLAPGATQVADTTGGSKSITATGATSGLTASTTFTVKPWVAFYNSANSQTTFSFIGTAPTSILVEMHGATAGTVSANSITIGGVATNHQSVVVGAAGTIYGLVVSPTGNVPFGPVAVVIQGTTFSYATGSIALGTGVWGGALISSIIGTATSTGVASLDAANYKPAVPAGGVSTSSPAPAQNQLGFLGYGFVPGGGGGGFVSVTTPSGVTWSTVPAFYAGNGGTAGVSGAAKPDANGALFGIAGLGDTAWSTSGAPTSAASYSPTFSQGAVSPANILSPSFGITSWIDTTSASVCGYCFASVVDYSTGTYVIAVHGFGATDVITVTLGGASMVSGGTCTAASGFCITVAGKVPDLGAGPQNVVATGSVTGTAVTLTGGATYDPRIDNTGGTAMNIVSGSAGTNTILRTGTTFGVHGLYPSTAYSIVWNGAGVSPIPAGTVIGTFTSTATGGIPVPGVQLTVPADISGIHNIDLQRTSTLGTSMMYGDTLQGDFVDADAGLGMTYGTQFGDMLFNLGTSLVATPTVATVGGSVTISGTGLQSNTLYDLGITIAGGIPPSTCPNGQPSTIAGQFTSTGSGTVPSGVSLTVTDLPTVLGSEQGTLYCIVAQTGPNFGSGPFAGTSQFLLEANANLNATSGPIGHNFIETAHGLAANHGYNILFAPYACGSSSICGTVVGAILTNGQGAGSATFTIPSAIQTATGSVPVNSGTVYTVQLEATGATNTALAIPPTFLVTSTSTSTCATTNCLTAGSSTITTIGPNKYVQTSFTNTSNAPVTAIVFAVIHNAQGQTVSYSTATLTNVAAGGSATAYNALFGLPPGTYSVTVFATSTSGTAISGQTTVSVTI
jgi:hypothetical protein